MRNCSLRAISPFPTEFSKDLYCRQVKTRACFYFDDTFEKYGNYCENNDLFLYCWSEWGLLAEKWNSKLGKTRTVTECDLISPPAL